MKLRWNLTNHGQKHNWDNTNTATFTRKPTYNHHWQKLSWICQCLFYMLIIHQQKQLDLLFNSIDKTSHFLWLYLRFINMFLLFYSGYVSFTCINAKSTMPLHSPVWERESYGRINSYHCAKSHLLLPLHICNSVRFATLNPPNLNLVQI